MNYQETKKILLRYLLARIPFINFDTIEKQRAIEMLSELSKEANLNIYIHSISKGFYNLSTNELVSNEKTVGGALDFISESLKTKEMQTFILTDVNELQSDTFTARDRKSVV